MLRLQIQAPIRHERADEKVVNEIKARKVEVKIFHITEIYTSSEILVLHCLQTLNLFVGITIPIK